MFSSPSYAEWRIVSPPGSKNIFHLDFDSIRKVDGYVYFWVMLNLLEPTKLGTLSVVSYKKGDCKLLRYQDLTVYFHTEPMGKGTGTNLKPPIKWTASPPNTPAESYLKLACALAKLK